LFCRGTALTYQQLNQQANQMAHFLRQQGVKAESLVGLCMDRSIEMIVGLLGILKAGGAYVPLDPHYPAERLAFMLADAAAKILLTQSHLHPNLPHTTAQVIAVDLTNLHLTQQSTTNPHPITSPDNAAYVIYTSGSTGTPKGVVVPHRGLGHLVEVQKALFHLTPDDRILQLASLSFDAATFEIVMALGSGATLVLEDRWDLLPGPALLRLLHEHQISVITITPSALALLPDDHPLPHLRLINVAGEACSATLVNRWGRGRTFCNLYGPTETTIWATVESCSPGEQPPPIGQAIPSLAVYLLDEHLQPIPDGTVGEIYIGGLGVTRGYRHKAALTATAFRPDPFTDQPGGRLYKTGDLAYQLPDGRLVYAGRKDQQVKIRGIRVELGEIEHRLAQHPDVAQAVTQVHRNPNGSQALVAYIVPHDAAAPTPTDLRHYVAQTLPEHMVPEFIVSLSHLPTTPNGKLDRQALPAPGRQRPALATPFAAPQTPTEQTIAALWSDILAIDGLGRQDNFFECGGHSLAITQVAARIQATLQVNVPLVALFEQSTIAQLAAYLDTHHRQSPQNQIPPIQVKRTPDQTVFPLSFSQERVWFMRELLPDNRAYNAQSSIRFRGGLDIPALEKALTTLVERHEMWRTTFALVDNWPRQHIHLAWTVRLPLVDVSHIPAENREAAAASHIRRAFDHVFDTTQLPLLHFLLIKLGDDDHVLVQVEHHFIHDGWSYAIQQQEFKALYTAFRQDKPSPLPPATIQFADFVLWQREWLQGEVLKTQLDYWQKQLKGLNQVTEILTDYPRPPVQTLRGRALRTLIPAPLTRQLRAFSQTEKATLFMVLLTGLKALLSRYTNQEDIVVGSSVANRRLPESEGLIGMIVNNVALRTDLSDQPTFREAVARVRQTALEAYDHQDIPFERIVGAMQPERDLSRNPFFQIIFSFHDAPVPTLELPDVQGEITYHQNDSAKFDLNVLVIPSGERQGPDELLIVWEYNRDLFTTETITRLAARFEHLLHQAIIHPDTRLSDLSFLTPDEEQAILQEWNNTATHFGDVSLVPTLVTAQARQWSEKVAVSSAHTSLTYQQLNERANQLAHYLITQGVGPETAVAVCLPQSPLNTIALLGILKAGGAYIPLDPSSPPERLRFMVADAQAQLVLTTELLAPLFDTATALDITDGEFLTAYSSEEPAVAVYPDHPAYIIYTSGSTGQPKGIAVTHRALYNLIRWHQTTFALSHQDRTTLIAGTAFDASVWELWPALTSGATLYVPEPELRSAPDQLQTWLIDHQITCTFVPTPLAEPLVELAWPAATRLRLMLTGGDKLPKHPPAGLPFVLVNNYGPSECTVVSTSTTVTPQATEKAPAIGRPIANLQAYVLDKYLRLTPVGVPGELYVGGTGLARGYWLRPQLTAAAFIPHPFSDTPGARLYRTGDLARWLADGSLEFLGRMDHQVKIRGFRIELGEIESLINQHPGVAKSFVIAHGQPQQQLVAYVTSKNGAIESQQLRAYLKPKLPDYMIPATFVNLPQFPITANGKIDRQALPVPESGGRDAAAFTPPETLVEEILADIWSDVLHLKSVSIHDNFFQLGGHSLLVTQVLSRIQGTLDVTVPVRDFFAAATIAQLAELVEEQLADLLTPEDIPA
jgi:amino acid adenylation domain-containing protein